MTPPPLFKAANENFPSTRNDCVRRNVIDIKPKIDVKLIATSFDVADKTIKLYTRLTNLGERDVEVHTLKLAYLKIFAADGRPLFHGKNITLKIEPCLIPTGTYVENVVWLLRTNYVPVCDAPTISDWRGEILCTVR